MPTYRITSRQTGAVLSPAVQADSEFSALSNFPEDDSIATQISPNPPAMVYTIAWSSDSPRGTEIVEVTATGSRVTALSEMSKQPPGHVLIEETLLANKMAARGRRS